MWDMIKASAAFIILAYAISCAITVPVAMLFPGIWETKAAVTSFTVAYVLIIWFWIGIAILAVIGIVRKIFRKD